MRPYADTNVFVRFYLDLPESKTADALMAKAVGGKVAPLPVTWLHRIELANAFELSVYLGRQSGHPAVTPEQAAVAFAIFREDLAAREFLQSARMPEAEFERQVMQLASRHTATQGCRTYDLMHVAAALLLGCDVFWSFDRRALKLAETEGLGVP
jgi:predicted nucleic acid-binding protein